jgi:hypothetical protein
MPTPEVMLTQSFQKIAHKRGMCHPKLAAVVRHPSRSFPNRHPKEREGDNSPSPSTTTFPAPPNPVDNEGHRNKQESPPHCKCARAQLKDKDEASFTPPDWLHDWTRFVEEIRMQKPQQKWNLMDSACRQIKNSQTSLSSSTLCPARSTGVTAHSIIGLSRCSLIISRIHLCS